jgi:hypothetical protein
MAKRSPNKEKSYSESELIKIFNLTRLVGNDAHPLLSAWMDCELVLSTSDQYLFDKTYSKTYGKIEGWWEEDLKMKFIAPTLELGDLVDNGRYNTYFERTVSAYVDGIFLKTKTDFMVAKGVLEIPEAPYFHFQEWKRHKDPSGDPNGQLLEAFLIAITLNANDKPMYGCTITGKYWEFFVMDKRTYCISKSYDCTEKDDLMHIIAVLRKFKHILETEILE